MRAGSFIIAMTLALAAGPAQAIDLAPLALEEAAAAIGTAVLTSDSVPLGHLIAAQPRGDGDFVCIVRLDSAFETQTSALIVAGLLRASDGTIRLPETASMLADRMRLPLGDE